jgi:hypothetical protein
MTARDINFGLILAMCASPFCFGLDIQTASAQDLASQDDQLQVQQKHAAKKPSATANALASVAAVGSDAAPEAKSLRKPSTARSPSS